MSLRPPASPNPEDNPRFAAILSKARELAYPKANLEAAIQKVIAEIVRRSYSVNRSFVLQALNPHEGAALQNITYEAIGAGGQVAFIMSVPIRCRNRAILTWIGALVNV